MCVCACVCVCVLDPFHLQMVNKLYRKYKPVKITQKEHMLIWNSETTQKPKHLSSPKRSSYFLATKHEKTIMACSYLNFSVQKINQILKHKQQKMVAFLKNCLVKMTLRLF